MSSTEGKGVTWESRFSSGFVALDSLFFLLLPDLNFEMICLLVLRAENREPLPLWPLLIAFLAATLLVVVGTAINRLLSIRMPVMMQIP